MTFDYDYLVIGSGFGGSVSALRMAEKGWRVGVVEQGRRIGRDDVKAGKRNVLRLMWIPALGMRGYFTQRLFRHLMVVGGIGVGGGSLVWGAVMLEPKPDFYRDPKLAALGVDWADELGPHFDTAKRMLGVAANPMHSRQDQLLRATADQFGVADTFAAVPNAVYFGDKDEAPHDPYFDGEGPARQACSYCGGCLTGCEFGSKNSLDLNYLYWAEKRGATVLPECKADRIEPLAEGGYRVTLVSPGSDQLIKTLTTRKLILSSGVLGTLEILYRNRDHHRTLPNVSTALGQVVRTNSEAITAVLHPPGEDVTNGTAISSDFHPDKNTHITQNRVDRGYRFMRYLMSPMVDDARPLLRSLKTVAKMIFSPMLMLTNLCIPDWEKRITVFTVMQDYDNHVRIQYRRQWWRFFTRGLVSESSPGSELPSYLEIANKVTRAYAKLCCGTPMSAITESVAGMSTTAHILSGCPMGTSAADSVIDSRHEVHGHPDLFVVDGTSIPANIGVNPSLTIAAMAERFAQLQPQSTLDN